jgi:ribose transport system permease protein
MTDRQAGLTTGNLVQPRTTAMSQHRTRIPLPRTGSTVLLLLFYLVLLSILSVTAPRFHTYQNAISIVSQASVLGIVAVGQTFAIISGGFDISVGGTVPLSAVAFAALSNAGLPILPALIITLAIGATVGAANAVLIMLVRLNPFIATLGTYSVTTGLALALADGQTVAMQHISAAILGNQFGNQIPYSAVLFAGIAIVAVVTLRSTIFGRSIYALGGNRETARLAGIRIGLIGTGAYVLCSTLAALAGVVSASQLAAGSPTTGSDLALTSIAAVIVGGASLSGGIGGVPGTVLGVLVIGTVSNGFALLAVPPFYQQVATGVILIMAITVNQLRARVKRRPTLRGAVVERERRDG